MNAKIMLQNGPHHEEFVGITRNRDGEWPQEIRIASGDSCEPGEKVDAAVYVYHEVTEWGKFLFLGSYMFVGNKLTAPTLITVWKE